MRRILFTLFSVACATAFAATVYKWVDENGVTHYSDQPHENAQKVTVAQPQTYSAPRVQQPPPSASSNKAAAGPAYTRCAVVQPANEDTFQNTTSVSTAVATEPGLRGGDSVKLLMDGAMVAGFPATGGSFTISPVDRGTHNLQAVVLDGDGKTVCQSQNVSFTILQASILNPANPNARH